MNRVWVKICGVTRRDDLLVAADAGADAVGVNFYPDSPRYAGDRAAAILRNRPAGLEVVGVFVNATAAQMEAVAGEFGLDRVQWVGDGRPDRICVAVRHVLCYRLADEADWAAARAAAAEFRPSALLIDAKHGPHYGGTGRTAPWDAIRPGDTPVPVILAGGLTPDNVADAVGRVRPWGVDVAGGVETSPGVKDAALVRRFVDHARRALS